MTMVRVNGSNNYIIDPIRMDPPFVLMSYSEPFPPFQPLQCFAFLPLLFDVVLPIPSPLYGLSKCYLYNYNDLVKKN